MRLLNPKPTSPNSRHAFTLLEVLLAILIAAGLLSIALFFYHQIAHARNQIILRTEFTSAARLFMDRLTLELRTARSGGGASPSFTGRAHSIQFLTTSWPHSAIPATVGPLSLHVAPALRQVNYGSRIATPDLSTRPDSPQPAADLAHDPSPESVSAIEHEDAPDPGQNSSISPRFQFLRFRYWDGSDWLDDWNLGGLPRAVEISLGREPLPDGTLPDEYPDEIFRRVVHLPSVEIVHSYSLQSASEVEEFP